MAEPTIVCPQCKTEIKLTESLAAPLLESVRRDYEQRLSQKDTDMAKREQTLERTGASPSKKPKRLSTNRSRKNSNTNASASPPKKQQKAKLVLGNDLNQKTKEISSLQEVLKQRDAKLAEAQKAQAELIAQATRT